MRSGLAMLALLGAFTVSDSAFALLVEKDPGSDPVEFTHFYPYPTSYVQVDERYAFDDDPLTAFVREPYTMRIEVVRVTVRRSMIRPRTQFVDEMYHSADRL